MHAEQKSAQRTATVRSFLVSHT